MLKLWEVSEVSISCRPRVDWTDRADEYLNERVFDISHGKELCKDRDPQRNFVRGSPIYSKKELGVHRDLCGELTYLVHFFFCASIIG